MWQTERPLTLQKKKIKQKQQPDAHGFVGVDSHRVCILFVIHSKSESECKMFCRRNTPFCMCACRNDEHLAPLSENFVDVQSR